MRLTKEELQSLKLALKKKQKAKIPSFIITEGEREWTNCVVDNLMEIPDYIQIELGISTIREKLVKEVENAIVTRKQDEWEAGNSDKNMDDYELQQYVIIEAAKVKTIDELVEKLDL